MTLVGYLYFQIYKNLEEGKAYVGKSLPVAVKNYKETCPKTSSGRWYCRCRRRGMKL